MSVLWQLLAFAALLLLSAAYSGSEIGIYSVSRVRVDAEARRGRRRARILRRLLSDDTRLLITLLIGTNLMLELGTRIAERLVHRWTALPAWSEELVVALLLTPIFFFLGELLPKDLFHQRPRLFLGMAAPLLTLSRVLYAPIAVPLQALSRGMEHLLGVARRDFERALGREEVLEFLLEGHREPALAPQAEELARNVLALRDTTLARVMLPWAQALRVDLDQPDAAVRAAVGSCPYTRVPATSSRGGAPRVVGYLHQIEILRLPPERPCAGEVRPLPSLPPDLPVDRALARMRLSGQRIALVGSPEEPLGLVTLMDLVSTIAGGLVA